MAFSLGIRGKIVLAGAVLACLGIAAVATVLTHEASEGLTDQARDILRATALQEANHVDAEFARAITAARQLARTTLAMRAAKNTDRITFEAILKNTLDSEPNWFGSWGTYEGDRATLDYHFGKLDFVHSGFGHIVLKTGVVGLALFLAMLGAFAAHYLRHRKYLQGNSRLLADAGMASLLFWVPTLLVGTPLIEFRTMLMFRLSLALVYVATGPETSRMPAYAVA